jgi:2,3-bisphosphoglycerate-dependent phosphoglycerate mutase
MDHADPPRRPGTDQLVRSPPVEIVLIRHAEPEWVREGLNVDDPPLTARGREQAELLAARLGTEQFDEVFVSPTTRTRETSLPVLARLGRPQAIDDWLEEIRNPVWHGTPAEKAREALSEERRRPSRDRWNGLPGGEAVRAFVDRVRLGASLFLAERGIERALDDLPVWTVRDVESRILLIAHAGTNAVVICHLLGLEPVPWEWDRFVLGHASITRLEAIPTGEGHMFGLSRLSDVEHLPSGLRTR